MKFKIDGEIVTNTVRKMYWQDMEKYEVVRSYLLDFLVCDLSENELEEIVIQILEGRKRLVGINEFDLVDDGKEIRELTEESKAEREKFLLHRIKEDMNRSIRNYVDIFACDKSWLFFRGNTPKDAYEYAYTDMADIAKLMMSPDVSTFSSYLKIYPTEKLPVEDCFDDSIKDILDHGAYLVYKPEFIEELVGDTVTESNTLYFYEKLYEYWENSEYKDDERVKERQNRYLAFKRKTTLDKTREPAKAPVKEEPIIEEPTKLTPDNFNSRFGIIDREGNYYSCKWGEHQFIASRLVNENKALFGISSDKIIDMYHALDMIIDRGYILIRDVEGITPKLYYKKLMHPNSYQEETIDKYCEHFDIVELEYESNYLV